MEADYAKAGEGMSYAMFLEHLKVCGGCTGRRGNGKCPYEVHCAVVETLAKKGLVRNSKELLAYGASYLTHVELNVTDKGDNPRISPYNAD